LKQEVTKNDIGTLKHKVPKIETYRDKKNGKRDQEMTKNVI
jgi:hypothetical protein